MMGRAHGKLSFVAAAAGLLSLAACLPDDARDLHAAFLKPMVMQDGRRILVSQFEVTQAQWKKCFDSGGCSFLPDWPRTSGNADYPATGVNYFDALDYIAWINRTTSKSYRLPTAAEWKTAAADLPQVKYQKLFTDPRMSWAADYYAMPKTDPTLRPSGSFGTLANGISDLGGNVWEWASTCAVDEDASRCPAFFAEGLHEAVLPEFIRKPAVGGCAAGVPPAHVGFRLVLDDPTTS